MNAPYDNILSFSKKERLGVIFLGVIIVAMLLFLNLQTLFEKEIDYTTKMEMEQELAALKLAIDSVPEKSVAGLSLFQSSTKKSVSAPFIFDPNTVKHDALVQLGFSDKQASSILNYRKKGGVIRSAQDFKKLYVVNDFMYDRLLPFIQIDESSVVRPKKKTRKKEAIVERAEGEEKTSRLLSEQGPLIEEEPVVVSMLDINRATQEELIALPGIGPVFSKNIIKYRILLGGYASTNQLSEVYGLKEHPEVLEALLPNLIADRSWLTLRNINEADWQTLVSHPYIDKKVANSIMAIRKQHGPFSSVEEVQKSHLVDPDLYARIAPYLTVDGDR